MSVSVLCSVSTIQSALDIQSDINIPPTNPFFSNIQTLGHWLIPI